MNGTTMTNPTRFLGKKKKTMPAKTSVLLYLVNIVICARNVKHGRTDNQLKKQEPKTCSIRWGWISLAKKGCIFNIIVNSSLVF